MPIYGSVRSIPELAPRPRNERWRVFRDAIRQHVGESRQWLYALPAGIGAAAGAWVGVQVWGDVLIVAVPAGLGGGIGGFVSQQLLLRRVLPHLSGKAGTGRG